MMPAALITIVAVLIQSAFAGRVRYEVRYVTPAQVRTSRSNTLTLSDQHMQLLVDNMQTWSSGKYRAYSSGNLDNTVIVRNVGEINPGSPAMADEMIREMVLVVMCNVPGDGAGSASIAAFNRNRDCKKRKGRNRVLRTGDGDDELEQE